jgi:hypothetical protein
MKIPGWLGPLVGPLVAVLLYFRAAHKSGESVDVGLLITFVAVGLFAGCFLWGIDALQNRRSRKKQPPEEAGEEDEPRRRSRGPSARDR